MASKNWQTEFQEIVKRIEDHFGPYRGILVKMNCEFFPFNVDLPATTTPANYRRYYEWLDSQETRCIFNMLRRLLTEHEDPESWEHVLAFSPKADEIVKLKIYAGMINTHFRRAPKAIRYVRPKAKQTTPRKKRTGSNNSTPSDSVPSN